MNDHDSTAPDLTGISERDMHRELSRRQRERELAEQRERLLQVQLDMARAREQDEAFAASLGVSYETFRKIWDYTLDHHEDRWD